MAKPVAVYLGVSLLSMFAVGVDCLYINGDYRWGAVALAKVRVRKSLTQQHMSHFSIGVKGGGGQSHDTGGHVRFSQPGSIKEQRYPQTYSSTSSRWTQLSQGGPSTTTSGTLSSDGFLTPASGLPKPGGIPRPGSPLR
ncbi:uncharacterized protein LOC118229097 isoform X2 [Anguilla anguilla]|uniref:uncharacterized protein LOC118229097 isoform X2 n=1 Tax=Anguilla anguilla TaxID=7936 RepID=UPI0015A79E8C|nr:uncharacterized protein LOC118229097 isoform X2 [Anguilla anguilla]